MRISCFWNYRWEHSISYKSLSSMLMHVTLTMYILNSTQRSYRSGVVFLYIKKTHLCNGNSAKMHSPFWPTCYFFNFFSRFILRNSKPLYTLYVLINSWLLITQLMVILCRLRSSLSSTVHHKRFGNPNSFFIWFLTV